MNTGEDYLPALVTYVIGSHVAASTGTCAGCSQQWPCDAVRLVRLGGYLPTALDAETVGRLRVLHAQARQVNGATPHDDPRREAGETLTAILHELVQDGVTPRRLADALGVTPPAIRRRLMRYGLKEPSPSMTDVHTPYTEADVPNRTA